MIHGYSFIDDTHFMIYLFFNDHWLPVCYVVPNHRQISGLSSLLDAVCKAENVPTIIVIHCRPELAKKGDFSLCLPWEITRNGKYRHESTLVGGNWLPFFKFSHNIGFLIIPMSI